MTLVAVIADTHMPRGSRTLPAECVDLLARADLILHAGDATAAGILETLRELAPVEAVRGNVDEPDLRSALPERRVAEVEDVRIGMVHIPGPSRGRADRLVGWFPDCGAVVYGHTHLPEVTRHRGVWILNPGSPTERRRSACRSMLTLQIDGAEIRPELVRLS